MLPACGCSALCAIPIVKDDACARGVTGAAATARSRLVVGCDSHRPYIGRTQCGLAPGAGARPPAQHRVNGKVSPYRIGRSNVRSVSRQYCDRDIASVFSV